MKTTTTLISGLLTACALMMAIAPASAANVDVNIGLPGLYVGPRPEYVRPEYENDWRERRVRADHWRAGDHHERFDHHDNRRSHGNRHGKHGH